VNSQGEGYEVDERDVEGECEEECCGIEKPLNCTGHVIAVVVESCDFAEDEAGGHEDACDGKIPGGCPGVMLSALPEV